MAEAAETQGTPTAPRRRWLRRTATALLATAPVLGGVIAPAAPATAAAHTAPSTGGEGSGSRTAEVSINTLTPNAPDDDDTLSVTGTLTNKGSSPITTGKVGLHVGPTLDSRSDIDQAAERKGYIPAADGRQAGGAKYTEKIGQIAPGASRSFSLKIPVDKLGLGKDGVYQLGVLLTGKTRARPYEQPLGIERSFLPWKTADAQNKTKLSYMWPLVTSTHMTAQTESDKQQTPIFRDDRLAREIAPGGRLQQMVTLGKDLPVTWVLDPDLLATVEAMTKRYLVETGDGGTKEGKGQAYARKFLEDLQDSVKGEEVVALPFADPDLASLAHNGKSVPGALSHLRPATSLASDTVQTILHTRPRTDFAWPKEGAVDSSIVDVATSAGAHNVIARSDSLRDTALSYSPTSARPVGGGTTALAADAGLSRAFEGDLSEPGQSSKAVQKFLADTQALTDQVPTKQRDIVVAPQRMPTAAQAQAMAAALSALNTNGHWTEGSDLSDAAKAKPDPNASRQVPSPASYPSSLRKQELPRSAYEELRHTKGTLEYFQGILTLDYRVITPFGTAMDRAVSNSWRGHPRSAEQFRQSVQSYLTGLTKKVHLIQKSPITLSGRSATIPVTVQNNLVQGVDGLELRLQSSRRIGLDVGEAKQVRVDGGHSQSVKFDTTANANGRSYVTAQLYTKDGRPYGKPMRFQVNVTSITGTVLLVIAGGILLVVLAGVRMYTQRKRRGNPAPDPDAPLEPAGGGTSDEGVDDKGDGGSETGGGQDGTDRDGTGWDNGGKDTKDPDAGGSAHQDDTGGESTGPSSPGEKVER
ncbi:DUF6049 family protein [Streptomyces sp. ODS28]|uniref:DUF6049 family protein n=1 Tax=Streptomyces sp. ODS28 TaxID=3136688 RepID=UPI0031E736C9